MRIADLIDGVTVLFFCSSCRAYTVGMSVETDVKEMLSLPIYLLQGCVIKLLPSAYVKSGLGCGGRQQITMPLRCLI